jgi:MinD superfamily P-loop ATPase
MINNIHPEEVADALAYKKREAINQLNQQAAIMQAAVIGTDDLLRVQRLLKNLESAKKLISNTAQPHDVEMLNIQYVANINAQHPIIKRLSFDQFVEWIVNYERTTTLASAVIESIFNISAKAAINNAQSEPEINAIMSGLSESAFAQLQAQLSG